MRQANHEANGKQPVAYIKGYILRKSAGKSEVGAEKWIELIEQSKHPIDRVKKTDTTNVLEEMA